MALLTFLSVLAALAGAINAQCPISGCDGLRSFSSTARTGLQTTHSSTERHNPEHDAAPRLLWSSETHRPSGAGCVTNGAEDSAVVICPMAVGQNASVVSFSAANGSVLWTLSLASLAVLPLVSIDGGSVVSDGKTLDWLAHDGRSLAPPVTLFPVQGPLFDLTITLSTSIVTILYKCGFISTYTVDGIPISGLWLNDTQNGVRGTFVPLANPVINDTRLYILSAFRPHTADTRNSQPGRDSSTTLLRLYAINVAAALDHKFTILWTYNVTLRGIIPYLSTVDTYCNSLPPDTHYDDNHRGSSSSEKSPRVLEPPPGVLTMTGGRILGSVSILTQSGEFVSFNMSVRDLGKNYSLISSGYSNNLLTALCWGNSNRKEWNTPSPWERKGNLVQAAEGEQFWASVSLPGGTKTVLELLLEQNRPPVNSSSLVLPTSLTTPVTLLQSPTDQDLLVFGTNGAVSDFSQEDNPHLVGVVGDEGGVVPSVKWSLPLPFVQPARGQISSLSFSSRTLLFLTTPLGVYAYQLT